MEYVKLIEPDGTENINVTIPYAIDFCQKHPGWSWRYLESNEVY